jgi:hypothetical protein
MNRNILSNMILCPFILFTVPILWSLGEVRLDAYISMFTLEYFVVKAIFNPRRIVKDVLALALLTVFAAIVSYKILQVLHYI